MPATIRIRPVSSLSPAVRPMGTAASGFGELTPEQGFISVALMGTGVLVLAGVAMAWIASELWNEDGIDRQLRPLPPPPPPRYQGSLVPSQAPRSSRRTEPGQPPSSAFRAPVTTPASSRSRPTVAARGSVERQLEADMARTYRPTMLSAGVDAPTRRERVPVRVKRTAGYDDFEV